MIRPFEGAPTVVTHASGVSFAIQIRSHTIMVDQTLKGGGCDVAPTPLELLDASLGSCIAYYVHHFFHTRGLPADGIRVDVTQATATNPSRVEAFKVKLFLPFGISEKHMELLQRVIDGCPVHNTLRMGAKVTVEFETPVPEMIGA